MRWLRLFPGDHIAVGSTHRVDLHGELVLLCRPEQDAFYAVEDCCSHDGSPLGDAALEGAVLQCPRHGARFDVRDGRALRLPAVAPLQTYPLRRGADGVLELGLEGPR